LAGRRKAKQPDADQKAGDKKTDGKPGGTKKPQQLVR
jgi:hypothetical protein